MDAVKLVLPSGEVRRVAVSGGLHSFRQLRLLVSRVDGLQAMRGAPLVFADSRKGGSGLRLTVDGDKALQTAMGVAAQQGRALRLHVGGHQLYAPEEEAAAEKEEEEEEASGTDEDEVEEEEEDEEAKHDDGPPPPPQPQRQLTESAVLRSRPDEFAARLQEASRRQAARVASAYDEFYQSVVEDATRRIADIEEEAREAGGGANARAEAERSCRAVEEQLREAERALLEDMEAHMLAMPPPPSLLPVSVVLRLPVEGSAPLEFRISLKFTDTVGDVRHYARKLAGTLGIGLMDPRSHQFAPTRLVLTRPPPKDEAGDEEPARMPPRRPRSNSEGGAGGVKGFLSGLGSVLSGRAGQPTEGQRGGAVRRPRRRARPPPGEVLRNERATVRELRLERGCVVTVEPEAEAEQPGSVPAETGDAKEGDHLPPLPAVSASVLNASAVSLEESDEGGGSSSGGSQEEDDEDEEEEEKKHGQQEEEEDDDDEEEEEEPGARPPRTAYEIYVATKAPLLKKELPTMSEEDVLAAVLSMWRSLPPALQRDYEEQAAFEAVSSIAELPPDGSVFGRDSSWEAVGQQQ